MENDAEDRRPTIGRLWARIKGQPLPEKLLFFSQVVILGASTLPWVRGHAGIGEYNAWQLSELELVAMLVPVVGFSMHLGSLAGLRTSHDWRWLGWYRFGFLGLCAVVLYDLVSLPMKDFGYWLCFLGLLIQGYALHPLLRSRGLLPGADR